MKINFNKKISIQTITWTFGIVFMVVLLSFCLFYPASPPRPPRENTNTPTLSNTSDQTEDQIKGDCIDCKCNADDWFENCCNNCEKTFDKPINVVWTGNVFAYMSSGANLAIKRVPENREYPLFSACCIDTVKENGDWIIPPETWITGKVKVTGKWLGITCAYVNTIFGRCVPDVDIEKIEEVKPYTPVVYLNDLKWWTAKISEKNLYADVNIEYPQFIGGNEVKGLNNHIKKIVTDVLFKDRNYVEELINREDLSEDCNASDGTTKLFCSVQLSSSYKVISTFNDIVSVELELVDYTGGGNGNHSWVRVINWDLKNNLPLNKEDIFCTKKYPDNFALLVAKNILNTLGEIAYSDEDVSNRVDSINEELQKPDSFVMSLGYHELWVLFQPYKIGSGVEGIIRSKIPYSFLKDKICVGNK